VSGRFRLSKKKVHRLVLDSSRDPGFASALARDGRYVFEVSTRGVVPFSRPRLVTPYLIMRAGTGSPALRLRRIGALPRPSSRGNLLAALDTTRNVRPGLPAIPPLVPPQPPRLVRPERVPNDMAFPLRGGGFATFPAFAIETAHTIDVQESSAAADTFVNIPTAAAAEMPWFGVLPDGLWSLEPAVDCRLDEPACRRNFDDSLGMTSVQLYFGMVGD
jgi:hypothetical protein